MSDGHLKSTHKASDQRFKISAQGSLPLRKALFLAPAPRLLFVLFVELKNSFEQSLHNPYPGLKEPGD